MCRIVVYGDDMLAATVPRSARTFNFHQEFCMTEQMVSVWMHISVPAVYPVGVFLLQCMLPPRRPCW